MRSFNPKAVPPPPEDFSWVTEKMADFNYLAVEIGCGTGMHSLNWAKENPDGLMIAIERTQNKFARFSNEVSKTPLKNLVPIRADAINWLSHYVGPGSVDEYFILYPNPYPKKKQANLRFHNMPFMSYLVESLKTNGKITVATNEIYYKEECLEVSLETWGLTLIDESSVNSPQSARTLFEKKYLERGDQCFNLVFSKSV